MSFGTVGLYSFSPLGGNGLDVSAFRHVSKLCSCLLHHLRFLLLSFFIRGFDLESFLVTLRDSK